MLCPFLEIAVEFLHYAFFLKPLAQIVVHHHYVYSDFASLACLDVVFVMIFSSWI